MTPRDLEKLDRLLNRIQRRYMLPYSPLIVLDLLELVKQVKKSERERG